MTTLGHKRNSERPFGPRFQKPFKGGQRDGKDAERDFEDPVASE